MSCHPDQRIDFTDNPDRLVFDNEETSELFETLSQSVSSQFQTMQESNPDLMFGGPTSTTLDHLHPQQQPERQRHSRSVHTTLHNFIAKGGKPPKKEYVRCKLIRGQKRINRQIANKKPPTATLNRLNSANEQAVEYWNQLNEQYNEFQLVLGDISRTEAGPATDGQARRVKVDKSTQRSFNNEFCKAYFSDGNVVRNYHLYIEYLFAESEPSRLCTKFDFRCCNYATHTPFCEDRWGELKYYLKFAMLEEIGCDLPAEENHMDIDYADEEPFDIDLFLS